MQGGLQLGVPACPSACCTGARGLGAEGLVLGLGLSPAGLGAEEMAFCVQKAVA